MESRKPLKRRKFINSEGVNPQTTFRMLTRTHFLVVMTNQQVVEENQSKGRDRKDAEESSFLDIQIF